MHGTAIIMQQEVEVIASTIAEGWPSLYDAGSSLEVDTGFGQAERDLIFK